jgi:hypothetical protein
MSQYEYELETWNLKEIEGAMKQDDALRIDSI